jgi:TonB family protein
MHKNNLAIILLIALVIFSCNTMDSKKNTIPTDQYILLGYSESVQYRTLISPFDIKASGDFEIYNPSFDFIDDFSSFHEKERIFLYQGNIEPDEMAVILIWHYDIKTEVSSFPTDYSMIEIHSLINDSTVNITFNGKSNELVPNSTLIDSALSIRYENLDLILIKSIIHVTNYGRIEKSNVFSSDNWPKIEVDNKTNITVMSEYQSIDEYPLFIGGDSALYKYLANNINYPTFEKENNIEGTVFVEFYIDSRGKVKNPKILQSVSPSIDSAALKAIENSPDWTPGRNDGKDTTVGIILPIKFKLK